MVTMSKGQIWVKCSTKSTLEVSNSEKIVQNKTFGVLSIQNLVGVLWELNLISKHLN
jgi:hypothetical protein